MLRIALGVELAASSSVTEAHAVAQAVRIELMRQLRWISSAEVYAHARDDAASRGRAASLPAA